jgi:hypothetical protein
MTGHNTIVVLSSTAEVISQPLSSASRIHWQFPIAEWFLNPRPAIFIVGKFPMLLHQNAKGNGEMTQMMKKRMSISKLILFANCI